MSRERAYGPYRHGSGYRVVTIGAAGDRSNHQFATQGDADAFVAKYRAVAEARTIGEAVNAYVDQLAGRDSSRDTARYRLEGLLGRRTALALTALTAREARATVAARSTMIRGETLRSELGYANRWAEWCAEQGWLKCNPFDGIAHRGERSRGKPQLDRIDDSRRLWRVLLADQSPEATAVMAALVLGVRASEVVDRMVRDLDDDARVLCIPFGKTKHSTRRLRIPEPLRTRLLALTRDKAPQELIFGFSRHALGYHTVRLAKLAGVPRVTPHGLRGLHATIAVGAGETARVVAAQLGHNVEDLSVVRGHYLQPGAEQSANADAAVDALNDPRSVGNNSAEVFPTLAKGVLN